MWNVPGWRSRASKEVADVRILTFLSRFLMFFWYHWYPKKAVPRTFPEPRPKVDARIHMALNCGARSCRIPKFDTKTSRFWHGDASNVAEPRSVYLHMHLSGSILAEDAQAEILRSVTISFSFTRAGSKVLKPPLTNFLKNELWNEDNSVVLKTQPAFLILSETILPAKVTKEVLPLQCIAERIWVGTLRMLSFYILKFSFFQSRFRVGHCCGSKPGKLMMYIWQVLCIVVPFDGVVAYMWVFLFYFFLAK